jgi:hypothetical protein
MATEDLEEITTGSHHSVVVQHGYFKLDRPWDPQQLHRSLNSLRRWNDVIPAARSASPSS